MRPKTDEYSLQAAGYVELIPEKEILPILLEQLHVTVPWWRSFPESSAHTVHPPNSWEVRQVLQHMADAERVFGYRMFRIARGDSTPLEGFDENEYAANSLVNTSTLAEIINEFAALREANLCALRGLPISEWGRAGVAAGSRVTVRGLAYILAGHVRHHNLALRKRFPDE